MLAGRHWRGSFSPAEIQHACSGYLLLQWLRSGRRTLFINALKMVVIPLIVTAIINGMVGVGDGQTIWGGWA